MSLQYHSDEQGQVDGPPLNQRAEGPADVGLWLRRVFDGGRPMGSWTGLPAIAGAPLSGALIGAGLGGLYGGVKNLLSDERPKPNTPWWKKPWAVGALAGGGLGLASAALRTPEDDLRAKNASYKQADYQQQQLIRIIESDPSIAFFEKQRLLGLVQQANGSQLSQMLSLALSGGLTAAAAHTILGTGFFGSSVLGGLAALATNSYFNRQPTFV